ncbi:MAG: two-component system response regulator GlrR, partial [Candidatus Latescibacteria bacterium]|nr:two-component system response regulator GlrR [Candidatus Latescibacterota bacterium]
MHEVPDQSIYQTRTPAPRRLITRNACMQHLLEELGRLAEAKATVLIQGESGTGKEVFAHAVHQRSPRSRDPFIRLNCAALP